MDDHQKPKVLCKSVLLNTKCMIQSFSISHHPCKPKITIALS